MVGVNRTGKDNANIYNGSSSIYDPTGKELIKLIDEEKIIEFEINLEIVKHTRKTLPFLNDIKLI